MHHETNWPFFLLAFVFLLLRFIGSAVSKAGKNNDRSTRQTSAPVPPPLPRSPQGDLDTERVRKFLEALGQPPGTTPAAPVKPRTDIPARPLAPVQPPRALVPVLPKAAKARQGASSAGRPAEPTAPILPGDMRRTPTVPAARRSTAAAVAGLQGAAAIISRRVPARLEPYRDTTGSTGAADAASSIQNLLRSPGNLRKAIILREVFGPPRSLQPIDFDASAGA